MFNINQRGSTLSSLLISVGALVLLFGVVASITAVSNLINSNKQLTTFSNTSQIEATSDASTTPVGNKNTNNQLVDYQEFCTGKTIKVHESDLIKTTDIHGQTVYVTPSDKKCYDQKMSQGSAQSQNQNSNPTTQQVSNSVQTDQAIQEINKNTANMNNQLYNQCLENMRNNRTSCTNSCDRQRNETLQACEAAYGVNGGLKKDSNLFSQCLDQANNESSACRDQCYSKYQFTSCNP